LRNAGESKRLFDYVKLQALTNALSYQVLCGGFSHEFQPMDRARIGAVLAEIERMGNGSIVGDGSFAVTRIDYLGACATMNRKTLQGRDPIGEIRNLLRDVRKEERRAGAGTAAALPLTAFDLRELRYLASPEFEVASKAYQRTL
jgi:hypothetical protein